MPSTDPQRPDGPGPERSAPRRSLVTGGAGFIGSHLVRVLLARGDAVTVVDDLSTGRQANLPEHASLRFVRSDLGEALAGVLRAEAFEEVYHLAAAVGVQLVMDRPIESIRTNVLQTDTLLRFVAERCPDARVLIASSSEVYGKSERTPFREDDDLVLGPTSKARWSYACSKAIDEHLALAYADRSGMRVVVARFFNTVGPGQLGQYGMVLPRFVADALAGRELTVHGDGSQSRCFCDVRDVVVAVEGLLAPANIERTRGRVFNIGADTLITIADLARLVIRTLASTSGVRHVAYEQVFGQRFEDLHRRQPDLTRIGHAIGWKPTIDLARTIRDLARTMGWVGGGADGVDVVVSAALSPAAREPLP